MLVGGCGGGELVKGYKVYNRVVVRLTWPVPCSRSSSARVVKSARVFAIGCGCGAMSGGPITHWAGPLTGDRPLDGASVRRLRLNCHHADSVVRSCISTIGLIIVGWRANGRLGRTAGLRCCPWEGILWLGQGWRDVFLWSVGRIRRMVFFCRFVGVFETRLGECVRLGVMVSLYCIPHGAVLDQDVPLFKYSLSLQLSAWQPSPVTSIRFFGSETQMDVSPFS